MIAPILKADAGSEVSANAWRRTVAALLPLLLLASLALAQPYAAGGGYGRPWRVGDSSASMRFALAAGDEGAVAFWSDSNGILSRNLKAQNPPQRLVSGRGIRELTAVSVDGSPAVAWARRDLGSGSTKHWLRWRGEERLLLDALQPYEMSIVATPLGPAVLMARSEDGDTVLRLLTWDGSESELHRSRLSLVRYRGLLDEEGRLHVVWLEGFRDRTAIGVAADEWTAYLKVVGATSGPGERIELGPASYEGTRSQIALSFTNGRPQVLWSGPNGTVLYSDDGEEPLTVGLGTPVGIDGRLVYWAQDASLRTRNLATGSEPVNVSWSPITVQRAELVEAGGVNYLAWYGPTRGGDYSVYAADESQPLQTTLIDRLAAAMNWSPWHFWQAFLGQLLAALVAAAMICMMSSPFVWLGALVAIRAGLDQRTVLAGILVGSALLLGAIGYSLTRLPVEVHFGLFGTPLELLSCLVLAALATWLIRRRADPEPMIGILGSAWLFLFIATWSLGFITFQTWLELWSSLI